MQILHWLRSRQEEFELSYWFSIVSYDQTDHSFLNRVYFFYLIVFFSVWFFAVLTFFAGVGAAVLKFLIPADPASAALFLELLLLGGWCLFNLWQSLRRSPIVFTEPDEVLVCQTPLNRSWLILRWLLMPWLKSGILFWLVTVLLGYSCAEIAMAGDATATHIFEYVRYGLRAWAVFLPVQLSLFTLTWITGVERLQKDRRPPRYLWLIFPSALLWAAFLLAGAYQIFPESLHFWQAIADWALYPLAAGFTSAHFWGSLGAGWGIALLLLALLALRARNFNLSRAAQETHEVSMLETALRYGFTSYATQLQDQKKLGVKHSPTTLPAFRGASVLVWKGLLQEKRSFRYSSLFTWLWISLLLFAYPLLPGLGSRLFAVGYWAIQVGQVSSKQIHKDLSNWPLLRQLPLSGKQFIALDLLSPSILVLLVSLLGLMAGSFLFNPSAGSLAFLLPGAIASIANAATFDMCRQARSSAMMVGTPPGISAIGMILELVFAIIPFLAAYFFPGPVGLAFSVLLSLGLGVAAFALAKRAYQNIGKD